jgi:hypothetical protein
MEDVLGSKAVMRQSVFAPEPAPGAAPAAPAGSGLVTVTPEQAPLVEAMQAAIAQAEARWRSSAALALGLGGAALLAAVGAIGAVLAR